MHSPAAKHGEFAAVFPAPGKPSLTKLMRSVNIEGSQSSNTREHSSVKRTAEFVNSGFGAWRSGGFVWCRAFVFSAAIFSFALPGRAQEALPTVTPQLARIFAGRAPKTLGDLRAMERHQTALAKKVIAATVSVQVGANYNGIAFGSGVIVSSGGLVMSAAHVAGEPGRNATVRLADGRILSAISLGVHRPLDAGLLQITDQISVPHLPVNRKTRVVRGQWCAAAGHPGGYTHQRGPVFRLGRVLSVGSLIRTDCQLAGGDSGGPLVNMKGEVIGINSRIGISLSNNLHTPAKAFDRYWDGLVDGEVWSGPSFLGVRGRRQQSRESITDRSGAVITFIHEESPAEDAGIEIGDLITRFGGQRVHSFSDLVNVVQLRKPGERVDVELVRDGETKNIEVRIGHKPT